MSDTKPEESVPTALERHYVCDYTLGKFFRFIIFKGMISSVIYVVVGIYIIIHVVKTEKVSIEESSQFLFQEKHELVPIEDVKDDDPDSRDKHQISIYRRRNVTLWITLAATLILVNLVQFLADILLFHSTLRNKNKPLLDYWMFFLLDVILWVITLICFVTIFSAEGTNPILLVILITGTAIRAYIVYILHGLMAESRKLNTDTGSVTEIIHDTSTQSKVFSKPHSEFKKPD